MSNGESYKLNTLYNKPTLDPERQGMAERPLQLLLLEYNMLWRSGLQITICDSN